MLAVWIVAVASIAVVVLVWLCAAGIVKRNPIAGIRIPSLFASDEAWRAGHRAALPTVVVAAVIAIVVLIAALVVPSFVRVAVVIQLVLVVAGLIVGAVFASRAAQRVG